MEQEPNSSQEQAPQPKVDLFNIKEIEKRFESERSTREKDLKYQQTFEELENLRKETEGLKSRYVDPDEYKKVLAKRFLDEPVSAFSELGIPLTDIVDRTLGQSELLSDPIIQQLKRQVDEQNNRLLKYEELEKTRQKELEDRRREEEENNRKKADQEARSSLVKTLKEVVAEDPDRWELVETNNAYDFAIQKATEYYQKTGQQITPEDVLDSIERHLEQRLEPLLKSKKLRSKIGQKTEITPPNPLTNNDVAGSPIASNNGRRHEEEKRRRIEALLPRNW